MPPERVAPEKLITHRYHGMEQIIDAMNLFLNHDRSLIKPVIYNDWAVKFVCTFK